MIPTYRTILYATDLSPNAAHAFRHALGIARCHDANIHILHVLPEMDAATVNYVATVMGEERFADLELEHESEVAEKIRKRLADFVREELAGRDEETERVAGIEVHHGPPALGILEAAERLGADLVVMGSHGKGLLKHAFLGSVAERVLRKAPSPIMVVPLPRS
ncbi:MAG: universal stress protein [Desulfuromonas sp.]|uniref:universal stress protein n=1 Tax=Desulfuromonas sp. TaxID=892 RepID=UPI000CC1D368|nr:universal stress protein [Desulfuromonas sp.]PLX83870.1 MAG: universal stress protein [Desulfuromonas sp.]